MNSYMNDYADGFADGYMNRGQPLVRSIWGEVVTEEPLLNRIGPLFVIQVLLFAWYAVLMGATLVDIAFEGLRFNWNLFAQIWLGVGVVLMLIMWMVYKLWFDACRTLPFRGQHRQRSRGYVIGMPMHSTIQRAAIIITFLFTATTALFSYILEVTNEFKGHFEHTTAVRLLQTLMTLSATSMAALYWSLVTQYFPNSSVQNVMVTVPVSKVQ